MAQSIGGIFGKVTGNIGNYTVRVVRGKTIISARPKHYNASNSPKSIETRQNFAVTSAFTHAVWGLSMLHEIWEMNKGTIATAYNAILKYNLSLSSAKAPTLNNIITPPFGFQTPVIESSISENKLTGSLVELNTDKRISNFENDLSINAVVCLSGPKEESEPFYKIFSLSKEVAGFEFGLPYDFEINLDTENAALVAKYTQKIIYLAVATKSQDNKLIRYSRSYSKMSN
jgi:hypothetical protein